LTRARLNLRDRVRAVVLAYEWGLDIDTRPGRNGDERRVR
jgi:hypothetical protein